MYDASLVLTRLSTNVLFQEKLAVQQAKTIALKCVYPSLILTEHSQLNVVGSFGALIALSYNEIETRQCEMFGRKKSSSELIFRVIIYLKDFISRLN